MYRDANVIGRVFDVYQEEPRGQWQGATVLVIEDRSNVQYPAKVAVQFSGASRDKISGVTVGDVVHVRGEPESRPGKEGGRWFTTVRGFSCNVKSKSGTAAAPPPPKPEDDLPF